MEQNQLRDDEMEIDLRDIEKTMGREYMEKILMKNPREIIEEGR